MMKYLIIIVTLFSLSSCGSKWDSDLLIGKWETTLWEHVDDQTSINGTMNFEFDNKGRYTLDYGTKKEVGKYWVFGTYLHTVEDDQKEKRVKIVELSTNNLSFHMNRSGTLERVLLKKVL